MPKLDSLVSGRNGASEGGEQPSSPATAAQPEGGEAKAKSPEGDSNRSKNRSQGGKGRDARKPNLRKNNKTKGQGGQNGKVKAAKHQDVDGNVDPNAAGDVGTSLNLTLSKALMGKLKRQAKSEGVSMEALATELISEGAVLRAWEIVERKGHLRDASSNQSGNSYGNGNGGNNQRRGNNRNGGGNQQKNGNSRNMNKQRYNAIMDDKANFLEYVRNQEKYNR